MEECLRKIKRFRKTWHCAVEDPMGPNVDSDKQWVFPNIVLTDKKKKEVVGEVMKLAVEVLFRSHV